MYDAQQSFLTNVAGAFALVNRRASTEWVCTKRVSFGVVLCSVWQ